MKKLLFILILLIARVTWAAEFDPFKGPKPIAILINTDPWLNPSGSDTPQFALYEDGQVIYAVKENHNNPSIIRRVFKMLSPYKEFHFPQSYVWKQLKPDEFAVVKQELKSFGNYAGIKRFYMLTPYPIDQPETKIYLDLDGKTLITSAYGLNKDSLTRLVTPQKQKIDECPESLKNLYQYLTTFHIINAQPWKPQYIEAMVWGYEHAPDKSILWPKDWPGLKSRNTFQHTEDAYSIFLPGSEMQKLIEFLSKQRERGAVEIDGKKWSVAARQTFPSQPIWSTAFGE